VRSSARLVLAALALGLAAAPAAQATDITNPAEHPAPITVEIDGQTYRDGADTLPGYDDYACTPIPNVQYDFGNDEIQYYDGQGNEVKAAHWTEWSRISSYQAWADQQQQGNTPAGASTPSTGDATPTAAGQTTTSAGTSTGAATPAAAGPAATGPATTTGSATKTTTSAAKTKTKTKTKTTTVAAKTKATTTASTPAKITPSTTKATRSTGTGHAASGTTSSAHAPAAASHAKARGTSSAASTTQRHPATKQAAAGASASDPTAAASTAAPASGASPSADQPKYQLVSDKGANAGVGDTRPIGIGILIAVFAAAGLAFVFGVGRRGLRASS
jgi:hypothetical protein